MGKIILDVYFGSKLAEELSSEANTATIFNSNNLFILSVIIFVTLVITIIVFLIIPKINKTPKKYYQRYLLVRKELERIDELYAKRKLSFENYAYTQFHYAKEYEHIIEYLSQFPEYKSKLKSYKLNLLKQREADKLPELSEKEIKDLETTNYFIKVLTPVAIYYRKEEIHQALLDEGYSKEISAGVIKGLEKADVDFNSKEITDNRKAIELVDVLLETKKEQHQTKPKDINQIKDKQMDLSKPIVAEKSKSIPMPEILDNLKYTSKKATKDTTEVNRPIVLDKSKRSSKLKVIDRPMALPKPIVQDKPLSLPKPVVIEKPKDVSKPVVIEKPKEAQKTEPKITNEPKADSKTIESTTIDLNELIKNKPEKPVFEELTTFSKYTSDNQPAKQKNVLTSIKSIFKSKDNSHSVSEINDIFKNIDKKLK